MKLKYNSIESDWMEGLPIGNGRLAAMLWGTNQKDIISLNNEWLWTGITKDRECDDVSEHLTTLRNLIAEEKWFEAAAFANLYWGGKGGLSGIDDRIDNYQPAGDLILSFDDEFKSGERSLDIENGVASVVRNAPDLEIKTEAFASSVDDKIVFSWKSDSEFSGVLSYEREDDKRIKIDSNYMLDKITVHGDFLGGIDFNLRSEIVTDGQCQITENGIHIANASKLCLYIDIFTQNSPKSVSDEYDYDILLNNHMKKFSSIMNRVSLEFSDDKTEEYTDALVKRAKNKDFDNALLKLYFDYGRYLFLSCSVCADLPLNLQGKWNRELYPPWGSDYHLDINLQMCYWGAEAVNMSEYVNPMLSYMRRLCDDGKISAQKLYNCQGTVLPLSSDAWAKTAPEAYGWGVWIGAAGWLGQHLWQHYLYNGDKEFLRNQAYPYFCEVAAFYEDFLVPDENGIYQIIPSQSPENRFEGIGSFPVSIGKSSAMDVQIAYDSLGYAILSAETLECDFEKIKIWKNIRDNLPEFRIGSDGRLLEWDIERVEVEPGHRHLSHLYGVYPSDLFNEYKFVKQYNACKKALIERLSHGGGHTGWSRAWVACLFAKFGDGESFFENYAGLLCDFATDTLLDLHPPRIFQIDGNIGAVAAMIEALVSVSGGKVRLLSALPEKMKDGKIKGIKLPGGHTISFYWENSKVKEFDISLGYENEVVIIANGKEYVCKESKKVSVE